MPTCVTLPPVTSSMTIAPVPENTSANVPKHSERNRLLFRASIDRTLFIAVYSIFVAFLSTCASAHKAARKALCPATHYPPTIHATNGIRLYGEVFLAIRLYQTPFLFRTTAGRRNSDRRIRERFFVANARLQITQ